MKKKKTSPSLTARLAGSSSSGDSDQDFPSIRLPIRPPYPPAEAKLVEEIPHDEGWLYEPKWDGFRCIAFRKGSKVLLQSKAGQPLHRYFPELVEALHDLVEHARQEGGRRPRGRAGPAAVDPGESVADRLGVRTDLLRLLGP